MVLPHFIAFDLDHECWIEQGLYRLERYLAKVARFQEIYGSEELHGA